MALNPQQQKFKELYLDPGSETFGNARGSAIAAGYEESYADNIMNLMPAWLSEIIGNKELVSEAEKALKEAVSLNVTSDKNLWRYKLDAAKFVAERLGKEKFSKRQELTGPDGKELPAPIMHVSRDDSDKEDQKS